MSPSDHRGGAAADTEGKTIRWARLYDLGTTILSLGRVSALRRKMVELAAIAPGERILDVGCGPGRLTILAGTVAGPSGEACGIDPAPEMVDLARRNAERADVEVRFQVGAIEALPYPDDYFDVVLSSLMLHHLPDGLPHVMVLEAAARLPSAPTRVMAIHQARSALYFVVSEFDRSREAAGRARELARNAGDAPAKVWRSPPWPGPPRGPATSTGPSRTRARRSRWPRRLEPKPGSRGPSSRSGSSAA